MKGLKQVLVITIIEFSIDSQSIRFRFTQTIKFNHGLGGIQMLMECLGGTED